MSLVLDRVSVALGNRRVAEDVSFDVAPGEIVALLAANGAGKTSLMRASLGLVPLASGAVSLANADPHTLSPRARALRAAYLPQRPQAIWPVAVESLVALGRYAHGAAPDRLGPRDQEAVDAAIEGCGLGALRTRRMDEISGGEKARAHLARALAQQASLLVLDEPTAGLDPAQALAVSDILRAEADAQRAVLVSTHDIAWALRTAHRFVLLREGRMLAIGGAEALTEEALRTAYGRTARVQRVDGAPVVLFE